MKGRDRIIKVSFCGSGHYEVIVEKRNVLRKATVTNMELIDRYKNGSTSAADRLAVLAGRGNKLN